MELQGVCFQLISDYKPSGDQPEAIRQLVDGLNNGEAHQVLLGVTGSGKTFTIANVLNQINRPALIISHNKTLAAQLFAEFKAFFPNNLVEFFISYYDYFQPEAYLPSTDTYIEKDLAINSDIEKYRLRAAAALLSGRKDVIIVSSVSCIYGMGSPEDYAANILTYEVGQYISRDKMLYSLVNALYARSEVDFKNGNFRVRGDSIEVYPPYEDFSVRITFFGNEIEKIQATDPISGRKIKDLNEIKLFPATLFVTTSAVINRATKAIQDELMQQVAYFNELGLLREAHRLKERTEYDLEMMREIGYCKGIENYSRHLVGRKPGSRPFCLLDYFPEDFLLIVDESHTTIPQIRGMFGGDRSRKMILVENGFRLPSALDNRPLKFDEFENMTHQVIYVSATPGDYELEKAGGVIVEQIVRPTGLLDPPVEVRPLLNAVDDLLEEIDKTTKQGERVLVTTLTKRMSEELSRYLVDLGVNARYIHSEIDALERIDILRDLRLGKFDVLIGINLLREGLDLPEVSLVAIMDADKEGFLRSERAFIQIAGRAARNSNGRVILYADKITESMQKLLNETERRRSKQKAYNLAHNITPQTISRAISESLKQTTTSGQSFISRNEKTDYEQTLLTDPIILNMPISALKNTINATRKKMEEAAERLDFINAARHRDEMFALEKILSEKEKK